MSESSLPVATITRGPFTLNDYSHLDLPESMPGHMTTTVLNGSDMVVMTIQADGQLEFPLLDTYPDSVKDAAAAICEHVSTAHKTLAVENIRLTARIKRLEDALAACVRELTEVHWQHLLPEGQAHLGFPNDEDVSFSEGLSAARAAYKGEPDAGQGDAS